MRTLRLAWPVVLGHMGHIVIGVADNTMIGHLSYVHLSAATVANGVFFLTLMLGLGVSMALTPMVAEKYAVRDTKGASELYQNSFWLHFVLGIILAVGTWLLADIIPYLGQPDEVVGLAVEYIRWLSFSFPPLMLFMHYKQFLEGLSKTIPGMLAMVVVVLINIGGNYLLIFGKLGLPAMGLKGAALATIIARFAGWIAMWLYVVSQERYREFRTSYGSSWMNTATLGKLLSLGLAIGLQLLFEVGAFVAASLMVGWIGAAEQAAHSIAINLASITYSGVMGLSAAASIRVADAKGRGDMDMLKQAGWSAVIVVILFMSVCSLIFILGKDLLPSLYIDDPYVLQVAASLLIMAALFQVSDGIQGVMAGALRGLQDVTIPSLFVFMAYWVIGLPVGYLFGFIWEWGANGVWFGLFTGLSISAVLMVVRFRALSKKRQYEPQEI